MMFLKIKKNFLFLFCLSMCVCVKFCCCSFHTITQHQHDDDGGHNGWSSSSRKKIWKSTKTWKKNDLNFFFSFGYKTFPNIVIMKRERQWNKKKNLLKWKKKNNTIGIVLCETVCGIIIKKKNLNFFFSLNSIESNRIDDKKTHTHTHIIIMSMDVLSRFYFIFFKF